MSGIGTGTGLLGLLIGGLVGGAGALGGAALQSSAAGSAAGAQAGAADYSAGLQYQASQNALNFEEQQWQAQQAAERPWLSSGSQALGNLDYMLGLGGGFSGPFLSTGGYQPSGSDPSQGGSSPLAPGGQQFPSPSGGPVGNYGPGLSSQPTPESGLNTMRFGLPGGSTSSPGMANPGPGSGFQTGPATNGVPSSLIPSGAQPITSRPMPMTGLNQMQFQLGGGDTSGGGSIAPGGANAGPGGGSLGAGYGAGMAGTTLPGAPGTPGGPVVSPGDPFAPQPGAGSGATSSPSAPPGGAYPGAGGFGSLMQPYGQTFQAPDGLTMQNDPGYQARLNLAQDAMERSAAARGGLLTGGTLQAENQLAQDYASNEYGNVYNRALNSYDTNYNVWSQNQANQFNRLAAAAGVGQTAAGQLGQFGSAAAGQIGNTMMGAAQGIGQAYQNAAAANASGMVGSANAWGGALGGATSNLTNLYMMNQLMQNSDGNPYNWAINPNNAGALAG